MTGKGSCPESAECRAGVAGLRNNGWSTRFVMHSLMFSSRRLHTGWRVLVVGGLLALVAAGNVDLDAASIQSDTEAASALTSREWSGKVLNEHERNGLIATLVMSHVRASPDYRTISISADRLRNQLQGMNNAELLRKHSEMPGEVDNELDRVSAPGTPGGHQAVVEEAERVVADAEKMLRDMKRLSNVDEQQLATAELSVSPDYVEYLRSLAPIPKLVHVIWPDKDVVHSNLEMVKQGIYRIMELNPSWTLLVHDDDDVDRTIRNSTLLSVEDKRILEHAHPVERADVFRLHIMYTHGGLYTDIDRVMNVRYHTVLPHGARLVLPTNYDSNFMQDNFGSSRGNRLFKCMLDQQSMLRSKMERRRGWLSTGSIMRLGPDLFNRQISLALFGKEDASRNSEMVDVRRALDRTRPVIVTRKDEWCDGLFITPYDGCKAVSKNGLYKAYGIKPWSGAVQERWKEEERDAADAEKILRGTKLEQCFQDLTLPDGCARAVAARGRRNLRDVASPQEPPAGGSMQVPVSEYSEIQTIHDVPHAYYRRCEIDADTDTRAFSYHDSGSHSLNELNIDDGHGTYQHRSTHFLPTAAVTFCIPDGIVVDSSLGGPSTRRGLRFLDDNSNDAPPPIYFKQTKRHFVNLHQFANWLQPGRQQFAKRPAATTGSLMHSPISMVDYPGMGIQLSAWTGFKYNHFVYDTFVRLALVYDRITTADAVQDPGGLWRNAKLIVSLGTDAKSSTVDNLKPGVRFVFDRLNLTSRLVANTGWLKIAKSTPRFEYLVMPDADPIYHVCIACVVCVCATIVAEGTVYTPSSPPPPPPSLSLSLSFSVSQC